MGGHGGLNILPQKKWNVYRKDIQFKVHFNENKIIKETKEKEKEKNALIFEKHISELKRNLYDKKENEKKEQNGKNEKKQPYEEGHINLFSEEEKEINRKKKLHEDYLIKVGHYIYNSNLNENSCIYDKTDKVKIVSDFDKIKQCQDQWFLNKKYHNSIFDIEQNNNGDGSDQMSHKVSCKQNINDKRENQLKRKKCIERNIKGETDEESHLLYNEKSRKNINEFEKEEQKRKRKNRDDYMEWTMQRKTRKQDKREKRMDKERSRERKKEKERRKRSRHKDIERNIDRNGEGDKRKHKERYENRSKDKDTVNERQKKDERKGKQCKPIMGNEWYF